ncbi:uncharacterized protein KY384_007694 [Bacidia gigantensis]|uniref:uncharacterized protein n=1 Tax=Bacidia gigantensis TaxID=2732470 RepID=UPI001D0442A2|nr:uncharacterized protein KY384_007694 [Bacidia gigantensis]KAG8527542.1 hypothetical protein KY384_007694 [Bacidia gigantensis]
MAAGDNQDLRGPSAVDHVAEEISKLGPEHPPTAEASTNVSMVRSYRKPVVSAVAPLGPGMPETTRPSTELDRKEAMHEERALLLDNNITPPNVGNAYQQGDIDSLPDEEAPVQSHDLPTEGAPLLTPSSGGKSSQQELHQKWEDAVLEGRILTTWQLETKTLSKSSAPLVLAFFLEYSLTVASIFTVGHIGKVELGAVALASMTANITGFGIYNGLATALDTLCPQAWGSGRKKLVGLQTQRMVFFLWTITIPIGVVWMCADLILMRIVPDRDVAVLAGRYLKILILGAPGYSFFESTKRYLQAQGLFSAPFYILLVCAPLNAFMHWLFVWKFNWGFNGAPIAVVITDILLATSTLAYIVFRVGLECWPGFSKRAFQNWRPMIQLAIPGFLMVEAEIAAFELLSLFSSFLGTSYLAAESVLFTLGALTFQTPFSVSVSASNRIASLIGASLPDAAKTSARVTGVMAVIVGVTNAMLMISLRDILPSLFTNDAEVITLIAQLIPVMAAFQLFDAVACCCNGILRGLGRQKVGGYVQVTAYYAVAIPISLSTAFGLDWRLYGLWAGVSVALFLVSCVEIIFLYRTDWEKSVEDAKSRNENG